MSDRRRERQELHAFQDGELPLWRRWRLARRLARDEGARRELESIAELGALLREEAAARPAPELWEDIRARLATAPRPARVEADDGLSAATPWIPGWIGAGLAAASVAAVMASGALASDAAPAESVRWLDSKGKPVMVLQDDHDATIIWVLPQPDPSTDEGAPDAVA